jgi:hypothetical protein
VYFTSHLETDSFKPRISSRRDTSGDTRQALAAPGLFDIPPSTLFPTQSQYFQGRRNCPHITVQIGTSGRDGRSLALEMRGISAIGHPLPR